MDEVKDFAYVLDMNKMLAFIHYDLPVYVVGDNQLALEYLKFYFKVTNNKVDLQSPDKDKIFNRFVYKALIEKWDCKDDNLENHTYIGKLNAFDLDEEPYTYKYETKDRIFKIKDFNGLDDCTEFVKNYVTRIFVNLLFVGN